ncbi:Molybdopterin synthase sulfur carrier subunit [Micractinium conductrix]|uniref:Molybdopterin synthase sulfur carrier subunit n=1 Tax=Micractinium conductrix TaxID=554055 RepID=A0A2P6VR71_9CHLO|nr:Molybdopterin synthase sulfur carrier subunit [Micractinium conductrix]|eukprot:PSC76565.1 Molybdopterin synthase sulfur carrier subunit [Micractinium conductrix]
MDVRVLFFARSRELAGTSEATLALEAGSTTAALLPRLMEQYPWLAELGGSFVLSLNQEYLAPGEEQVLKAGDEVAVIPPISGG